MAGGDVEIRPFVGTGRGVTQAWHRSRIRAAPTKLTPLYHPACQPHRSRICWRPWRGKQGGTLLGLRDLPSRAAMTQAGHPRISSDIRTPRLSHRLTCAIASRRSVEALRAMPQHRQLIQMTRQRHRPDVVWNSRNGNHAVCFSTYESPRPEPYISPMTVERVSFRSCAAVRDSLLPFSSR